MRRSRKGPPLTANFPAIRAACPRRRRLPRVRAYRWRANPNCRSRRAAADRKFTVPLVLAVFAPRSPFGTRIARISGTPAFAGSEYRATLAFTMRPALRRESSSIRLRRLAASGLRPVRGAPPRRDAEHFRGDMDCNRAGAVTLSRVPDCKFTCCRNRCEEKAERITGSWHRCLRPLPSA
jgi:hypothetical protein